MLVLSARPTCETCGASPDSVAGFRGREPHEMDAEKSGKGKKGKGSRRMEREEEERRNGRKGRKEA